MKDHSRAGLRMGLPFFSVHPVWLFCVVWLCGECRGCHLHHNAQLHSVHTQTPDDNFWTSSSFKTTWTFQLAFQPSALLTPWTAFGPLDFLLLLVRYIVTSVGLSFTTRSSSWLTLFFVSSSFYCLLTENGVENIFNRHFAWKIGKRMQIFKWN